MNDGRLSMCARVLMYLGDGGEDNGKVLALILKLASLSCPGDFKNLARDPTGAWAW
jgi:hypothetical protein